MSLLKWALILAILAAISALLGFTDLAAGFAGIAKVLFFVFVIGVVIFVALGVFISRKIV